MRFLVSAEAIDYAGPISPKDGASFMENLVIPSFQTLEKWEKEGRVTGGGFPAERSGCFIVEASSAEDLNKMLSSLPLWGVTRWSVHALISFGNILERAKEQADRFKAMASRVS